MTADVEVFMLAEPRPLCRGGAKRSLLDIFRRFRMVLTDRPKGGNMLLEDVISNHLNLCRPRRLGLP